MKREYIKYDLYPVRAAKDDSTAAVRETYPTPAKFEAAETALLNPHEFKLIKDSRLILYEKDISVKEPGEKKNNKFIAYIQFTSSADLSTAQTKDSPLNLSTIQPKNLSFLTRFLFQCCSYVSLVQNIPTIFCGYMWTIGWRKSQTEGEMAG
jgi:hypothetical protein